MATLQLAFQHEKVICFYKTVHRLYFSNANRIKKKKERKQEAKKTKKTQMKRALAKSRGGKRQECRESVQNLRVSRGRRGVGGLVTKPQDPQPTKSSRGRLVCTPV